MVWKQSRTFLFVADIQCRTTVWLNEQPRAIDELMAQRVDRTERPDGPALSVRAAPLGGARLQRPRQIERDGAQHLPGAVGLVALGGRAVERKAALELAVDLLMGAAART